MILSAEGTVVAEFEQEATRATAHQSEADLEREFIALLRGQAYEYLTIRSGADLLANLRVQVEALNSVTFTDSEWARLMAEYLAPGNDSPIDKTVRVQEDHVYSFRREDGSIKNISLIDKQNIHNNRLQVINQYEVGRDQGVRHATRYDVTILVNGLPLVHVELKRRGVSIREAFNQIDRYQRDSFWAGSALFDYVQIFVISNGTLTKYYSNSTRRDRVGEGAARRKARADSFEFTSWWADAANGPIQDLAGFTRTFFAKHTLLAILTRYCVLTVDRVLLVMRPYQIVATERILSRIAVATNYRQLGTLEAGGYVWHTTGSGKTLTSFKTAQLASRLPGLDKVLFVVDRKDLDFQTKQEYDRFEKGAANASASTAKLAAHLADPERRIVITTIQKLARLVASQKDHPIYDKHVVLIFDECHRSQFGEMHTTITRAFRRYNLFGFTGTPIFGENAGAGGNPRLKTTEQAFGGRLHAYTIVDAINDRNVLPFRIDYVNTIKSPEVIADKQVSAIDTERALLDPERIRQVVGYILEHFDQKTRRSEHYSLGDRRVHGFNSLFATASIEAAKRYYAAFARAQEHLPPEQCLKIGLVYSFAPNEAPDDEWLEEESFDVEALDASSRDFLDAAIGDFNAMFGTRWDTSSDGFDGYYTDLSKRLKHRDIDVVVVVNMLLTGFDARALNTLWVDKNLRSHGLIQAFSRTNRILNSVKTYGNIVSFRDLEQETNDAIALFGNKDACGIVLLRPYGEYYADYAEKVAELLARFPLGSPLVGEQAQKDFIALFGAILRLENILTSFDDFARSEMLSERQSQDYRSVYLDLYAEFRKGQRADRERINDDIVFEIELVKQVEINVDYILMMAQKRRDDGDRDKEIRAEITRAIDASPTLRDKKELIEDFVDSVSATADVDVAWKAHVAARRTADLDRIIAEEGLRPAEAREFVARAFRAGSVQASGTAITRVLPPSSRFAVDRAYGEKKQRVLGGLAEHVERYAGLGGEGG
jgi:type I restriction enzyme R subunit